MGGYYICSVIGDGRSGDRAMAEHRRSRDRAIAHALPWLDHPIGYRPCSRLLLNGHADRISPLRPRAVVVLDVLEAEQVLQREPGVAAALADPTVGDGRLLPVELVGLLVQLFQFGRGLEGAAFGVDRACP